MFQIDISGRTVPEFGVILISCELTVDIVLADPVKRTHCDRCKGDATHTLPSLLRGTPVAFSAVESGAVWGYDQCRRNSQCTCNVKSNRKSLLMSLSATPAERIVA